MYCMSKLQVLMKLQDLKSVREKLASRAQGIALELYIRSYTMHACSHSYLYIKEHWSLMQSGVDKKYIKNRGTKLFVKDHLHVEITDPVFIIKTKQRY